jgi:hypothetical protein
MKHALMALFETSIVAKDRVRIQGYGRPFAPRLVPEFLATLHSHTLLTVPYSSLALKWGCR